MKTQKTPQKTPKAPSYKKGGCMKCGGKVKKSSKKK